MAGSLLVLAILASITLPSVSVHGCETGHEPRTWTQEELDELNHKWGTDVRRHSPTAGSVAAPLTSTPSGHSPASTFAQLPHVRCLTDPQGPEAAYDIAILGVPFDTATSYRPGARFGPRAIRAASARQISFRGWNPRVGINPYADWARVLDCGDIPVTPVDNAVAVRQMEGAFKELLRRRPASARGSTRRIGECRIEVPKIVALGGDHSIALPALRALKEVYGRPLRVLHFDGA